MKERVQDPTKQAPQFPEKHQKSVLKISCEIEIV
jgi:hypothetical protein